VETDRAVRSLVSRDLATPRLAEVTASSSSNAIGPARTLAPASPWSCGRPRTWPRPSRPAWGTRSSGFVSKREGGARSLLDALDTVLRPAW